MFLDGRRRWGRNECRSGARSNDMWRGRNGRGPVRPTTSPQDRRDVSLAIMARGQGLHRLRGSRRGRHTGTRTWSCPTSVLLDDGFLQVANFANIAPPHPHVDHGGSLALRNLSLRFAFLLRKRWGQQAIVMLNEVHEQHWGQEVGGSSGTGRCKAYWLRVDLGWTSHSRIWAARCPVR